MTPSVWSLLFWLGSTGQAQETAEPPPDLIYFVLVDRFANGVEDTQDGIDTQDIQAFHGGDLQGIIDRLDHLQSMGIRTLWISPVAQIQTEKIGPWGAYHGYWITDHQQVEPRFGDFETLARLSTELHTREMRLVLDMVYNHVGPSSSLVTEQPDWFHPTGDIVDWSDPVERRTHRVHGLPDLDQDHPDVSQYLVDMTQSWLEKTGADGIRIDAIGHMEPRFVASLQSELRERGHETWVLGEDFQGDPVALDQTAQAAQLDAIYDFPLYYAMTDTLCGGQPMGRLASTLSMDRVYASGVERITFLDNHDLPRITSKCSETPGAERLALHLLFSLRGTPSLTYGTEAGLLGHEEPENRGDMPWDQAMPLATEIGELQDFRNEGPTQTRDRVLWLSEESILLLREGSERSLLVLLHLGDEALTIDWPDELDAHTVLHHARLDGDRFEVEGAMEGLATITAGPRSIHRWVLSGPVLTDPLPHRWEIEITQAPVCEGGSLRVVGAGPELGNWVPENGPELKQDEDGRWTIALSVPEHSVFAWHLVVTHPDQAPRWQDGPDRSTWVGDPSHKPDTSGESPVHREITTWEDETRCN